MLPEEILRRYSNPELVQLLILDRFSAKLTGGILHDLSAVGEVFYSWDDKHHRTSIECIHWTS